MLTNFAWVVPGVLARSGRPATADDYQWIHDNIDTVVVLDGDDEARVERVWLYGMDVTVLSFPISDWQIYNPFRAVPQSVFDTVLTHMTWRPGRTLVHCLHGQDRTGLAVAQYRVREQGWTKDAAMAEAVKFGYHQFWNKGLNATWGAF